MIFDVENTLRDLTTEEKVSLLSASDFWHTSSIERLNIPSIRVSDGPNGIRGTKFFNGVPSACFPNGTGLASTFDCDLLEEIGELMAVEAKHKGAQIILGPTTNILRGPLGGRGFESFSEDPVLSGLCTAAIVKGIQNDGRICATVKHFVCNDLEHERLSSNSVVSERALREIYLEPFRIAVQLANPNCIMTAYNKVNGIHCSENYQLIENILRKEWNWDGLLMSDWFGTYSTLNSLKHGIDIEFPGPSQFRRCDTIKHLLQSKADNLKQTDIDNHCRHILKVIKSLIESNGTTLFSKVEDSLNDKPETSEKLRRAAAEGIVLLKNERKVLPLLKETPVLVIGPNAISLNTYSGGGSASLTPYHIVTPLQGIKKKASKVEFTIGAHSHKALGGLFEKMTNDLEKFENGVRARFYTKPREKRLKEDKLIDEMIIKNSYVTLFDYTNPAVNQESKLFYADFEGYYTPTESGDYQIGCQVAGTAIVYIDDKILIDNKTKQTKGTFCFSGGTIEETACVYMQAYQKYRIKVEFGSGITSKIYTNFGAGGLQVGITKVIDPQKEIKKAASLAASYQNVILCIGLNSEWESEGYDREDMKLPGRTDDLVRAVIQANPNTVVINQSGTPVEMPWLDQCATLLQTWYGGDELGDAVADILYGDTIPCGKLPFSWPAKNEDNPSFLNFRTEKGKVLYGEDVYVGYRYYEKLHRNVAFPFGYGLSYTQFEYQNLKVSSDSNNLILSFEIKNIGQYAGKETAQVYISSLGPTISRPSKELKAFMKTTLEPGESKVMNFRLKFKEICSYYDEYQKMWCLESGKYLALVGASSMNISLTGSFDILETTYFEKRC